MEVRFRMASGALQRFARRITLRTVRFPQAEEGVVMTEFIIVAPLFVFLITGTIQFMGISHADALLQYANFMAARTGIVHYEPIMQGWDPTAGGNKKQALVNKMDKAAEHAFGPIFRSIAGYEELGEGDRPISNAPVGIFDVRVSPGTIQLPTSQYEYLPVWLTTETEVDMGLPWPWVGRVFQAIHVNAPAPTSQEQISRGLDPFSTLSEPPQMASMYYGEVPYIIVKSDAYLDLRTSDTQARQFLFPFNITGGQYKRIDHNTLSEQNVTLGSSSPQPLALPIQARLR